MSSAAPTAPATTIRDSVARRRSARPSRRTAVQLLLGVLVVGAIPIVSTVRILQANALRNEQAHTDAALRGELQEALRVLTRRSDAASARADELARSPIVQRALVSADRADLGHIAARNPGASFFLRSTHVAGPLPAAAIERSVWLTAGGKRIGKVSATVRLDRRLATRLMLAIPHRPGDRLVLVRNGHVLGTGAGVVAEGRTIRIGGVGYRGLPGVVRDATGIRLLALRPQEAIESAVAPYQRRVRYAAMGSFAVLLLVALLFAGPIMRLLGDFRRVASQASTDSLTGLANRRMLDEELALEWRRAHRIGDSLALVLLDLDDFKQVNDTYGHQAGDAVLRKIGELLSSGVRQVDLAARYGGEEFVVLAPESDVSGAERLAKRLRTAVARTRFELRDGTQLKVTASFGVAAKGALESAEDLLAVADDALYEAKRSGKNRVVVAGGHEARARIGSDAGLGEGGLRAPRGSGARRGGQRRAAKGRPHRPGPEHPA
jgi:diguanylate cyclase (GGDEF)-like protein